MVMYFWLIKEMPQKITNIIKKKRNQVNNKYNFVHDSESFFISWSILFLHLRILVIDLFWCSHYDQNYSIVHHCQKCKKHAHENVVCQGSCSSWYRCFILSKNYLNLGNYIGMLFLCLMKYLCISRYIVQNQKQCNQHSSSSWNHIWWYKEGYHCQQDQPKAW